MVVAYLSYLRVGFELVVCAFMLSLLVCTFCHSIFNFTKYFLKAHPRLMFLKKNSSYIQHVLEVQETRLKTKGRELLLGPLVQRTPTPNQDTKGDLAERRNGENGKQSFKPKETQSNLQCRNSLLRTCSTLPLPELCLQFLIYDLPDLILLTFSSPTAVLVHTTLTKVNFPKLFGFFHNASGNVS